MRHRGYYSFRDYADWHRLSADEKLEFVSSLDRERTILKVINQFAIKLISIANKNELAWYLAREVVGKLGFVDCVIYYLDADRNLLVQQAAIGPKKNPEEDKIVNALEIPVGSGITGHVAATRTGLIVRDLEEDHRYIPDIERARSEICVPILIDGEVVGVIDCEDPRLAHFNEDQMEILTTVAAMAGARLKMISQNETEALNAALSQQIQERIQAEEGLRLSEARFKDFTEIGTDIYWELDQDLCYVLLERNSETLPRMDMAGFIGRSRASVKPDEVDEAHWMEHLEVLASEKPFRNFIQPRRVSDGHMIWLAISGKPLYDENGEFTGYRGTATDVTEFIKMDLEAALHMQSSQDSEPN